MNGIEVAEERMYLYKDLGHKMWELGSLSGLELVLLVTWDYEK
jgi:hypothetical protein